MLFPDFTPRTTQELLGKKVGRCRNCGLWQETLRTRCWDFLFFFSLPLSMWYFCNSSCSSSQALKTNPREEPNMSVGAGERFQQCLGVQGWEMLLSPESGTCLKFCAKETQNSSAQTKRFYVLKGSQIRARKRSWISGERLKKCIMLQRRSFHLTHPAQNCSQWDPFISLSGSAQEAAGTGPATSQLAMFLLMLAPNLSADFHALAFMRLQRAL